MATLVLGAVGTALGGPVGGALGSLVGQAIDQQPFGSGPRQGPRLGDLSIQTSSYGTMIPRVYGAMRVAGSVVWATDLKEQEQAVSGGKGGSDQLRYSYSANFAVALSSRAGGRIGRIWADGKLLRGAAGDLKVAGTLRFLAGQEQQAVDPLIASIEGIGNAPAFRGMAVAVFEELALAEYGNRIPMLTFELIADDAGASVAAVLADASGGVIASGSSASLVGYAAHGSDLRAAIEPLVDVLRLSLHDNGSGLDDRGTVSRVSSEPQLGCGAEGKAAARTERKRAPMSSVPAGLALSTYDPARDYQSGMANAGEPGRDNMKTVSFAAAVSADDARRMADAMLAGMRADGDRMTLHLGPAFLATEPGDLFSGAGLVGLWRAVAVDVTSLVVSVELVRVVGGQAALPADGGRVAPAIDTVAAATQLFLLDAADGDGVSLKLAGASPGPWRPVPVAVNVGGSPVSVLTLPRPAVAGRAATILAPGTAMLFDDVTSVEVTLIGAGDWLTSCSDQALGMGANLAALGEELIQFGRAEPVSAGRFRLSHLLRGRRGTEWAIGGHAVGEAFVIIEPAGLVDIRLSAEQIGTAVSVQAHGLGDGLTVPVERVASGEAARPLAPCALRVVRNAGALSATWVRRSRMAFGWTDGPEAPLGEASEWYRVRITLGAVQREWQVGAPAIALTVADLAPLGSGPALLTIAQVGDRGASHDVSQPIIL